VSLEPMPKWRGSICEVKQPCIKWRAPPAALPKWSAVSSMPLIKPKPVSSPATIEGTRPAEVETPAEHRAPAGALHARRRPTPVVTAFFGSCRAPDLRFPYRQGESRRTDRRRVPFHRSCASFQISAQCPILKEV
jgi:hypothetical protein